MRFGDMIADTLAFLLLACLVSAIFLAFGTPFWHHRQAQMVLLLPAHAFKTASIPKNCPEPCLPHEFKLGLAPSRPGSRP